MISSTLADPAWNRQLAESDLTTIRSNLHGVDRLDARIESWMVRTLQDRRLPEWIDAWGSPLNLLSTAPFARNVASLRRVAVNQNIDFEVYFARKANKCVEFVEACAELRAGVDTASFEELRQAVDVGIPPDKLICTAAIKERPLLELCASAGVTVAIDNLDELHALQSVTAGRRTPVALRVSGFEQDGKRLVSRFGFAAKEAAAVTREHLAKGAAGVALRGIQFHLDGYCPQQRIAAIRQSLDLIDELRGAGHPIAFLDIGGGFPVCYLEQADQWEGFWRNHRAALLGKGEEATYRGHSLGLTVDDGRLLGRPNIYPFYQELVGADWLDSILSADFRPGTSIAAAIATRGLELRCEPGRALLDGCGMTVSRVVHRKRDANADLLVGVSMNRTQCRTGSDDFLVDPILVPNPAPDRSDHTEFGDGYLTGAYCTESEAILLRKLRFPMGAAVGDLIALPNTAGYFMHFYECRSHQFPLAKNRFVDSRLDGDVA